jgi:hypothetical protein
LLELERAVPPILFHRILGNYRHLVNMMGLVDKVKNNCLLHILRPCNGLCDDLCDALSIINSEMGYLKSQIHVNSIQTFAFSSFIFSAAVLSSAIFASTIFTSVLIISFLMTFMMTYP